MIKSTVKTSCFLTVLFLSAPAFANDHYIFQTCQEKAAEIQTEILHVKQSNNPYKVKKLERNLNRVNTKCSNAYLQEKYQEKVDDKQEDVFEITDELKQAQQKGNAQKIAKQQDKLVKKQVELKAAQIALETFKNKVKANQ